MTLRKSPAPCSLLALAMIGAMMCGCASSDPRTDTRSEAQQVRSLLLNDQNGLEVRQLVIGDSTETIANAMAPLAAQQGSTPALDVDVIERLRRNGFRLVRIEREQVDGLIEHLGGASLDMTSWQGQVYEWRDLHSLPIGAAGRAIAIDGRVRRYQGGDLRLMVRSWVVQMEDGARLQFELVPQHLRSESKFHRLLNQPSMDARALPSMAVNMLLEPGYAYVLMCESPQVSWSAQASNDEANGDADLEDDQPPDGHSIGPAALIGPEASAPLTVGEFLLSTRGQQRSRGVLVFIPRVASRPGMAMSAIQEQRP